MRTSLATLCLIVCLLVAGCGDDDGNYKPVDPYRSITSPENVIYNFALSFNKMNHAKFAPLIHEDFTYEFTEEDLQNLPGRVPQDGIWGKAEFLSAVDKMLSPGKYSCSGQIEVDNLLLELAFSGNPEAAGEEGAPPGTLRGFVTFDLCVDTIGDTDYLVNSRPAFYFAPDSSSTPVLYHIWRIEDGPFGQPAGTAGEVTEFSDNKSGLAPKEQDVPPVAHRPRAAAAGPPSLGAVLAFYAEVCS
jgi:hypothetical protein